MIRLYFVLDAKARQKGCSKLDLAMKAVTALSPDPVIMSAFDIFLEYKLSPLGESSELDVEMLSMDCVSPHNSRI